MAYTIKFGTQVCLDPVAILDDMIRLEEPAPPELFSACSFRLPLGQEPGIGYVLLTRKQVNTLNQLHDHTVLFDTGNPKLGQAKLHKMVFVSSRRLIPSQKNAASQPLLVKFADQRWLAKNPFYAVPINKDYNVPAPGYRDQFYTTSMTSTLPPVVVRQAWTWLTMVQDLWARCSFLGSAPAALPYTPHGEPEGWRFYGISAYDALGMVLARLGCSLRCNPLVPTGQYRIVQLGAADATFTNALAAHGDPLKIEDGDPNELDRATVPYGVRVFFSVRAEHAGTEQTIQADANQWSTQQVYSLDVDGPFARTTQYGIYKPLWDDMTAVRRFDGSIKNEADLKVRAAERMLSYYTTRVGGVARHEVYSGLMTDLLPGSLLKGLAWRLEFETRGETPGVPGAFVTEIVNHDWLMLAADGERWQPAPCAMQPPVLGPQFPSYPKETEWVQVKGVSGSGSDSGSDAGSGSSGSGGGGGGGGSTTCEGYCEYRWHGGWVLVETTCSAGCTCGAPPTAPGNFDGQTIRRDCEPGDVSALSGTSGGGGLSTTSASLSGADASTAASSASSASSTSSASSATSTSSTSGSEVSGSGCSPEIWDGNIFRHDPGGCWYESIPVWVETPNDESLASDTTYLARLNGYLANEGSVRPLYIVGSATGGGGEEGGDDGISCTGFSGIRGIGGPTECIDGILNVSSFQELWKCGKLVTSTGPIWTHNAGCCDCPSGSDGDEQPPSGSGGGGGGPGGGGIDAGGCCAAFASTYLLRARGFGCTALNGDFLLHYRAFRTWTTDEVDCPGGPTPLWTLSVNATVTHFNNCDPPPSICVGTLVGRAFQYSPVFRQQQCLMQWARSACRYEETPTQLPGDYGSFACMGLTRYFPSRWAFNAYACPPNIGATLTTEPA